MRTDTEVRAALTTLLERPDPPDLGHRGHLLTQVGDPWRQHAWRMALPLIYTQWCLTDRQEGRDVTGYTRRLM